jgi:hypothetical protein
LDHLDPDDPSYAELHRLRRAVRVVPDVSDGTWTSLLLAYLDAEERAVGVIGDWLEGEGLPRIKSGNLSQRVRHVLGLVPATLAHELACDFAEHMMTWAQEPAHPTLLHALGTKRRWLAGGATDLMLKKDRLAAQRLTSTFGAEAVAQAMSSSPAPSVAQRVSELAAKAILQLRERRYPGSYGPPRYPNGPEAEARWQAEHLRARLR